jgi:hypothetical protein
MREKEKGEFRKIMKTMDCFFSNVIDVIMILNLLVGRIIYLAVNPLLESIYS